MRLEVGLLCRRLLCKRQLCLSNTHRAVGRELVDDCQLAEPERSTGELSPRSNIRFGGAALRCGLLRKWWPSPDTGRDVPSSCDVSVGCGLARSRVQNSAFSLFGYETTFLTGRFTFKRM